MTSGPAPRFAVEGHAHPAVRVLRFHPSDRRGVLDEPALSGLEAACRALEADPAVRVVALEGARPALFAAGADLDRIAALESTEALAFADRGRRALAAFEQLGATTVAVVRGACYGGALDLALCADVVLAFPSASFAHPGVARGIVTGWGGTLRAARRLAPEALFGLFAEGAPVPAARALASGLADAVVATDDELDARLSDWAGDAGEVVRRIKRLAIDLEGLGTARALVVEERLRALAQAAAAPGPYNPGS